MNRKKSMLKRLSILVVLAGLLLIGLLGCQASVPEASVPETAEPSEIVTTPGETSEETKAAETVVATEPMTVPETEPETEPAKETEMPKETEAPKETQPNKQQNPGDSGSKPGDTPETPAPTQPPVTKPTEPQPPVTQPSAPTEHTHSYTKSASTPATCTSEGSNTYTCSTCGDSYTEAIPATDHNWVHQHQDEVKHEEGGVQCACGAKFATNDAWIAHRKNSGDIETQLLYHGGYHNYAEWVIDVPAKDWDECSVCHAIK